MILAAWDDEFLTPAELLQLREAIAQASGLEALELGSLRAWLDPSAPPSAAQLRKLRLGLAEDCAAVEASKTEGFASRFAAVRKLLLLPLQQEVKGGYSVPSYAALSGEEVARLREHLDGPNADVREQVKQLLSEDPAFRQRPTDDMHAHRELVLQQCRVLARLPLMQATGPMPAQAVSQFAAVFETIAQFDLSLVVKFGVQFGLYANAIEKLGTAPHHKLLPEIRRAELLGCFAMTERGHGSNVRGVQTRADYDAKKQEFVIHTPQLSAGKEWIGGAAVHARSSVVFAQLHTGGEHYGVHAFIVPLRTAAGALMPGVRAEDCGQKMGLNGVDNGRLWFDQVRVPRTALLNRFGDVAEDGSYSSPIPSESKRFFVMLATLVGGRINVAGGALSAAKTGLTIALRYGSLRRQFPDKSGKEQPLLNYQMHRMRLLPALAHAYGLTFAQHALVQRFAQTDADPQRARETEMLANGLKAVGTWRAIQTLQDCRECCGGQGYLTSNRLDALRTDTDVFTTFEGDNTVLCQQVAKERLRLYMAQHSAIDADAPPSASATTNVPPTAATSPDPHAAPSVALCRELLTERDERLIKALFERVQRRVEKGMDAQAAFEDCQDHTLALARAHVESFVSARFQEAVAAEPVLGELFELYCTSCVAEDVGWFLEAGLLSPQQARLLRQHRHDLVDRVATRALSYIEAFAIPEICLGPLADPNFLQHSGLVSERSS